MNLASISNPVFLSATHWSLLFKWSRGNSGEPAQQSHYRDQDMDWMIQFLFRQVQKIFLASKIFSPALDPTPTCTQWAVRGSFLDVRQPK